MNPKSRTPPPNYNADDSGLSHFIVFRRTPGHCVNWLLRAASLRDALVTFVVNQFASAELHDDGRLSVDDGYGGRTFYDHPLPCIEGEEKSWNGWEGWTGWEIRQLKQGHWEAEIAEVFCSEDPGDVEGYIECCRPALRRRHQRSRARAFAWYLKDGPLVTFYRPARRGRRKPIEVLVRYHLPWSEWPNPREWQGIYDDILRQMAIEFPLPQPDAVRR